MSEKREFKSLSDYLVDDCNEEIDDLKAQLAAKEAELAKLRQRIHNQRCKLRQNWQIFEERSKFRRTELNMMWLRKAIQQAKELAELRRERDIYFAVLESMEFQCLDKLKSKSVEFAKVLGATASTRINNIKTELAKARERSGRCAECGTWTCGYCGISDSEGKWHCKTCQK